MSETGSKKLNKIQIEKHLKSAVDTLTPNVLDRIDLSMPQDVVPYPFYYKGRSNHRKRFAALAAAACFCILAMGGGSFHYHAMNRVIESVIGLDVNPSIELSVNRKNKVLAAEALNDEAVVVLGDMNLEGVDVNVAVNAVVGSMVTQGYFDESDNAILVTVTNDSISKASVLRTSIVSDIEKTLEENQVQAVVYDQQVVPLDEVKELAGQYGISYGKAYFLKELIEQNQELGMDDMEKLSAMTMEEIAAEIAGSSYKLGEFTDRKEELVTETPSETAMTESETEAASESSPEAPVQAESESTVPEETTTTAATTAEETEEEVHPNRVEIDYVDYEDGSVYVYFVTKVKWKNPTVSVFDENGDSYAAMVSDTSGSGCVIEVSGLKGGESYTFVLGGLYPVEGGGATTITGYFDKPMIAGDLETDDDDDDEVETTTAEQVTTAASQTTDESETRAEQTTAGRETTASGTETKESETKEKESVADDTQKTSKEAAEEPEV